MEMMERAPRISLPDRAPARVVDRPAARALGRRADTDRWHPDGGPLDANFLLSLQKSAGNAAVTQLLVQRFESGEHARMGAVPGQKEEIFNLGADQQGKDILVSYGEMIAMGDFFEDVAAMRKEVRKQPERFKGLLAKIRKDVGSRGRPRLVSEKEWSESDPEYLELATKNDTHFAPSTPGMAFDAGEANHKTTWFKYHQQALELAHRGKKTEALEVDAFGAHFLTDAFSAGHMVNKQDVMKRAGNALDDKKAAVFAGLAAKLVLAKVPSLMGYQVKLSMVFGGWENVSEASLAKLILFVREHDYLTDDAFRNNFAKAVHDRLNRSVASHAEGVHVKVQGIKDPFLLAGDTTLDESPDTLKAAQQAVAMSKWQVDQVDPKGPAPAPLKLAPGVWDLVPQPTVEGHRFMQKVVDELTKPATDISDPSVVAFANVMIENMDALVAKLQEKGRLRPIPPAPAPAHPAPAH